MSDNYNGNNGKHFIYGPAATFVKVDVAAIGYGNTIHTPVTTSITWAANIKN